MPSEGLAAPDFTLPDQDGNEVSLASLRGQTVVPIAKFAAKQSLDFTLVADADHAVAEKYGAWVETSMHGKKYMGVQRPSFIVDSDGKIAKVFPKVKPPEHDELVLKALAELAR